MSRHIIETEITKIWPKTKMDTLSLRQRIQSVPKTAWNLLEISISMCIGSFAAFKYTQITLDIQIVRHHWWRIFIIKRHSQNHFRPHCSVHRMISYYDHFACGYANLLEKYSACLCSVFTVNALKPVPSNRISP